jgi:hypothetical protein
MDTQRELFADGIGEITLVGGMVRMSLVSLVGSRREGDQPRFETRERIIMPPDGFLRSFSAMEDLVKQLINAGLVKPKDTDAAAVAAAAPLRTEPAKPPKSPNF